MASINIFKENTRPGTAVRWFGLQKLFNTYLHKDMRVLDIGGFDGSTTGLLKRLYDIDAVIVDMDMNGLVAARERGLNAVNADACALPFPDQAFDCVLALDILEHIENDNQALSEISRIVKQSGLIILTTPILGVRFANRPETESLSIHIDWGHVRPGYEPKVLIKAIEDLGFEQEAYGKFFNIISSLAYYHLAMKSDGWRHRLFRFLIKCFEPISDIGAFEIKIAARKT